MTSQDTGALAVTLLHIKETEPSLVSVKILSHPGHHTLK